MENRLYIIMRSDLWDMNPGKLAAQAAHAQADFEEWARDQDYDTQDRIREWREDRSFGVTIVLSATKDEILSVTNTDFGGVVIDPTYPWMNWYGDMFTSEELTCGWLFSCDINTDDLETIAELPLHV